MRWPARTASTIAVALCAFTVGTVAAQLGSSRTASGSVTVSSTSADLYICEPGSVSGPGCGPDDSGADEMVFEIFEDLRPGQIATYDIRVRNTGTVDWVLTSINSNFNLTSNPTGLCNPSALSRNGSNQDGTSSAHGVFILGKSGDAVNDNPAPSSSLLFLRAEFGVFNRVVQVAPGDYEDLRLRVLLEGVSGADCAGAQWNVAYTFTVG